MVSFLLGFKLVDDFLYIEARTGFIGKFAMAMDSGIGELFDELFYEREHRLALL